MQIATLALAVTVWPAWFAVAQGVDAAKPPSMEERRARQVADQLDRIKFVAPPMDQPCVELLLTRVGFESIPDPRRAAFNASLAVALEAYRACRRDTVDAPLMSLRDAVKASLGERGMPEPTQASRVLALRASAMECDRRLIDTAITASLGHPPATTDERVDHAMAVRRTDAAASTLSDAVPGLTSLFVSVSPALDDLGGATGLDREVARVLLLGTAMGTADAAERYSFEWLNGTVFLAGSTALEVQRAAEALEETGGHIDTMQMMGVALTIQMRGVGTQAATLLTVDAALVQALPVGLPPRVAYAIVDRLAQASPGSARGRDIGPDIVKVVSDATALPSTTPEQRDALDALLTSWMQGEMGRLLTQLLDEARLQRELAQRSASLSAKDPSTWKLDGPGDGAPQQMAGAYSNLAKRRSDAEAAAKRVEAIIGPEAWKAIAPAPRKSSRKANADP